MKEIWKDVVGYEGLYQVSNIGNIKSMGGVWKVGNSSYRKERILKNCLNPYGYLRVVLCNLNGEKKYCMVHRLVAEAFIPNPQNKPQVNHIDENKTNNKVANLEWVTCKENINWGTSLQKRAEHQKLSQKGRKVVYQYDKNLNLITTYQSCHEAARMCGIDKSGIQHCCNGDPKFKTYKGSIWRYEKIEHT